MVQHGNVAQTATCDVACTARRGVVIVAHAQLGTLCYDMVRQCGVATQHAQLCATWHAQLGGV